MYVNPAFKTKDEAAWKFVEARGFGAIVAIDNGKPVSSHVPLLVERKDDQPCIAFHLARANPLHEVIARSPRVLVIVTGPDAYISPDWYVSADQVPTWNYVSVHLGGTARVLAPEAALDHVEAMSAKFESWLAPKKPWTTAKMPERKREAMLRAIVPIEVAVDGIEASWKLGQHKTTADQYEVARMLEWRGDWNGRAMAEIMQERFSGLKSAGDPAEAAYVAKEVLRMLVLKPNCECCDKDLAPDASDALICSFECTFCRDCAEHRLPSGRCPNCGGELVRRPVRPADRLAKFPASSERVLKKHAFCSGG